MKIRKAKIAAPSLALMLMFALSLTACNSDNAARDAVNDVLSGYNDPSGANTPDSGSNNNETPNTETPTTLTPDSGGQYAGIYGNTIGNLANSGYFATQGDRVYFENDYVMPPNLYSMKTDGTDAQKLNDNLRVDYISILDGHLYFWANEDGELAQDLYKMRTDGGDLRKIE